jgi:hypothetical protein
MTRTILAFLASTVLGGALGASAEWPVGSPLGPSESRSWPRLDGRADALDPLGAGSAGMDGQRLGPVGFGLRVAPRKLIVNLDPSDGRGGAGSTSIYHLTDSELKTTDIGLDLTLRWPSLATPDESGVSQLQPYVSLGPAVSVTAADEAAGILHGSSRLERPLTLGMHGALGLVWQVSRDASFFGEYRLTQDRSLGNRPAADRGVDLFYGFLLKF